MLPALARSPGHLLWRAHTRSLQLLADLLPPGVDLQTYGVLLALADGASRSQRSLAASIRVSPTTMVRVAAELARSGLVERVRNAADRRSYALTRTPAGAAAVRRWERHVVGLEDALAGPLSTLERDDLRVLLRAVVRAETPPEAPEPPEELLASIGFLLTRAHVAMHRDVLLALAPLDLEPRHHAVLTALRATGPVPQAELARLLGTSGPSVVAMVDDLEARGLLERRRPATDRRRQVLHLSATAPDVAARAAHLVAVTTDVALATLTPNQRTRLVDLLRRFVEG